jgi:hypothetical protein
MLRMRPYLTRPRLSYGVSRRTHIARCEPSVDALESRRIAAATFSADLLPTP